MNPAFTNMALSLGGMQLAKRLPMDDPTFINYLRIFYISSQVLTVAIYFYVTTVIRKKNDLTVLKYVNPASPMNPDAKPELVTSTVKDYDLAEVSKAIKGMGFGIFIMAVMHLYMKWSQPLLMSSVMAIKSALEHNETSIHLFGAKAEGARSRPFKSAPGLMDSLTGTGGAPTTDAASIKEAERAGAKKSQ